jgi:uncharacterized protein (DUF885 family)
MQHTERKSRHSRNKQLFSHRPLTLALIIALSGFSVQAATIANQAIPSKNQTASSLTTNKVQAEQEKAEKEFKTLYQKEAVYRNKEFPGRRQADDEDEITIADYSDAAEQKRLKVWRAFADEAHGVAANSLSNESKINLRIFSDQLINRINAISFNAHLLTFNSDSQFWASTAGAAEATRCANLKACEQYLKQLASIPRNFDQKIALMKLGIQRGMTMPQVVLTGRDASIQRHVVSDIEQSVFYKAFSQLPVNISMAQRQDLQLRAKKLIAEKVVPAYQNLLTFIRNDYMPNARKTIAAYDLPNGKAFYRSQILEYTTLDISPEEIHAIGLTEVARIRNDMHKIIADLKFDGDFPAFLHFLRTDPQFYAKTPHELLAEAAYWAKKADGLLIRYFGRLPRKPYGIQPVPADIAPTYTAGRYAGSGDANRPSNYWVNTSLLNQRPMWALPALTLHEAVPGHHLQIALAGEQAEQPEFRRTSYISAFGEGWGLYAEHLGVEMGIYENHYHHFGRLVYEMWRATRLVVDTGMHAKGWTREQAQQFMRENTAMSEHEITTEVDRYISWPGQALAYKLGELKIRETRKKTEQILGDQFDIRAFHDKLLSLGSVPLSILESEMIEWAKQTKKDKK